MPSKIIQRQSTSFFEFWAQSSIQPNDEAINIKASFIRLYWISPLLGIYMPTGLKKPSTLAQRNINSFNFIVLLVVICSGLEYQDHSPQMVLYEESLLFIVCGWRFWSPFLTWWVLMRVQKLTFLIRLKRKTTVINSVLMSLLMICCLLGKKVNTEIAKS